MPLCNRICILKTYKICHFYLKIYFKFLVIIHKFAQYTNFIEAWRLDQQFQVMTYSFCCRSVLIQAFGSKRMSTEPRS
jgi:hypothetical protein